MNASIIICFSPMTMRNSTRPHRSSTRRRPIAPLTESKSFKLFLFVSCLVSAHSQPQAGMFEFFKKFQESFLGSSHQSPRSQLLSPKSSRPGKIHRQENVLHVTQRRALMEYSLHTHYGDFIGSEQHLNARRNRSIPPEHSWTDKSTNCILYNEGAESFWTYFWCPNEHIKQVHLKPRILNKDGSVKEFVAERVIHLGTYKTRTKMASQSPDHELNVIESYDEGDECDSVDAGGLRRKNKRRTLVVFENTCEVIGDGEEFRILSVIESRPCRYTIRVCYKHQAHLSSTINVQGGEVVKEPSLLDQHVQEALSAYVKQSGLDTARMSAGDRTSSLHVGLPPFPPSRKGRNVKLIRDMFIHAYDSYMYNAYPAAELKPISCTPGTFDLVRIPALTLIDTLDTLLIMGNFTEFARATERLRDLDESLKVGVNNQGRSIKLVGGGIFAQNQNVSVFETTIRVLGGLLSAHQMAVAFMDTKVLENDVRDKGGNIRFGGPSAADQGVCLAYQMKIDELLGDVDKSTEIKCLNGYVCENQTATMPSCESFWTYDGLLLELAHDMGKRLLPAFNTKTGVPYGTVNLVSGIPRGETPIASLAGGGTLNLEFELLSRLTGDDSFGKAAKLASRALWMRRSNLHLLGKHLDVEKGEWTETLSGIGSNSDSFYEYMIKHYILFPEDSDFWTMFVATYNGVFNETRLGEWYSDVDMNSGIKSGHGRRTFESLMAFYPGMQVLAGELSPAAKTLNSFFMVRETTGLLPERFNFAQWKVEGGGAGLHPLRPELLESCYFLHRATEGTSVKRSSFQSTDHESDTGESGWLWAADYSLHAIHRLAWTPCGFAIIKDVNPSTTGAIPGHNKKSIPKIRTANEMPSFFLSETLKYLFLAFDDDNILHNDDDREWVFTTEAHPIHHEQKKEMNDAIDTSVKNVSRADLKMLLKKRALVQMDLSRSELRDVNKNKTLAITSQGEKWAIRTSSSQYLNDIVETEAGLPLRSVADYAGSIMLNFDIHLRKTGLIGSFVTTDHALKHKSENHMQREMNIAGLSWNSQGLETSISKGCPNIHSSSLLWMNALNGGVLDYGDVYVSSLSDDAPIDKRFAVGSLSASAALAFQGSGRFLGMAEQNESAMCPIEEAFTVPILTAPKEENVDVPEDSRRFDMGSDLGPVDVSVFDEGSGFYIHHVNSGETITATILSRGENIPPYIMVYSVTPPQKAKTVQIDTHTSVSWKFSSGSWKAIFNQKPGVIGPQAGEKNVDATQNRARRRVVVAFNPVQSFACEVQLVQRFVISKTVFVNVSENDETAVHYEKILSNFPCAPAMFGPTMDSELAANNGVISEGPIHLPDLNNILGCDSPENSFSYYPEDRPISIINRGDCKFELKGRTQSMGHDAKAVIIVNDVDDGFFLMSGATDSDPSDDYIGYALPVSVLVDRSDGDKLIAALRQQGTFIAKILIVPQQGGLQNDSAGNIIISKGKTGKLDWPAVKSTGRAIQIFASQGWGVLAEERIKEAPALVGLPDEIPRPKEAMDPALRDWQLYILQHNIKSVN